MMRALLVSDDLSLIREWIEGNPEARVWVWGAGLPRSIRGLEGRVLPASMTREEAEAYGEFDQVVELPEPAKPKRGKAKPKVVPDESEE